MRKQRQYREDKVNTTATNRHVKQTVLRSIDLHSNSAEHSNRVENKIHPIITQDLTHNGYHKTVVPAELLKSSNHETQDKKLLHYKIVALNTQKNTALLVLKQEGKTIVEQTSYRSEETTQTTNRHQFEAHCHLTAEKWHTQFLSIPSAPSSNAVCIMALYNQEDYWLVDVRQVQQIWMENLVTHLVVGFNCHERHEQSVILPIKEWGRLECFMQTLLNSVQYDGWERVAFSSVFICLQKNNKNISPLALAQ